MPQAVNRARAQVIGRGVYSEIRLAKRVIEDRYVILKVPL
jgi:hypothetical protein